MTAPAPDSEALTPLVRQLASQLRASRSGSAVAKSFPTREAAARPQLKPLLDAIKRVADEKRAQEEALGQFRHKLEEAEARSRAQAERLEEAEHRLQIQAEEMRRERARADELEARSRELLEKTQALLTEAGERLAAAETRADGAEEDLAYLQEVIRERLAN